MATAVVGLVKCSTGRVADEKRSGGISRQHELLVRFSAIIGKPPTTQREACTDIICIESTYTHINVIEDTGLRPGLVLPPGESLSLHSTASPASQGTLPEVGAYITIQRRSSDMWFLRYARVRV